MHPERRSFPSLLRATAAMLLLVSTPALAGTLLQHATVFDGRGGAPIHDASIRIADGRIDCIGGAGECRASDDDEIVDLEARYVTPGLVDAHVHFSQTGWLDGRPHWRFIKDYYDYEDLQRRLAGSSERWHRAYLCSGITAVFDVGGLPWTLIRDEAGAALGNRAHLAAAGPLITHADVDDLRAGGEDTFLPMGSDEEALRGVERLVEMGADAIKVWFLDPPANQREELVTRMIRVGAAAREHGLPMIVHATELENAKAALRAGAAMLVHSVEDAPVDDEFLELAARNGTIYAPTLLVGLNWNRATASVGLGAPYPIDDPNDCVDAETRARIADAAELRALAPANWRDVRSTFGDLENAGAALVQMQRNLAAVHAAGITIATATDAGNPLTLHGPSIYAEMEAMQAAGIPPSEIIVMSTANGARAMAGLEEFGTLEPGKAADLIVLTEDPSESASAFRSITHVMRAGRLQTISALSAR